MIRAALTLTALLLLVRVANAQDPPKVQPAAAPAQPQPSKYNPNDPKSIIDFIVQESNSLRNERDLLALRNRQNELERLLSGLPAGVPDLEKSIARAALEVQRSGQRVQLLTTAYEVFIHKVQSNADDAVSASNLGEKLYGEIRPLFLFDPDAAANKLVAAKVAVNRALQVAKNEQAKKVLVSVQKSIAGFERDIARSKEARDKQQDLIGQAAPPLVVETWLNGTPLTVDDMKGKVVLLCFFSAISFRPGTSEVEDWPAHLKRLAEWQTKYAERGLVVINLTDYDNVRWDEVRQGPMLVRRTMEVVPPEEERAMLTKLARAQGWTQRLAVLQRDEYVKAVMQYPALSQQTIVIDRQGKIRLVRGGVCEQFTRDISKELDTLLGAADR